MKIIFQIVLIIILFSKNLFGQDLFETSFYNIQFTSDNIEDEKISNIQNIKKLSILNIFKKTLYKTQYTQLADTLNDDLINVFIKNIIINNEKIVNNTYFAKIKINFDKTKIVDFYRKRKLPYIEYYPKKFLLIINENKNFNDNLFSNNNSFYKYFKDNIKKNDFFLIPNLDINDRFLLNKNDLENNNNDRINQFLKKYESNQAVIVLAKIDNNISNYNFKFYSDSSELSEKTLNTDDNIDNFFKLLQTETLEYWKRENSIQNNKINFIKCNIYYYNLYELKEIKKKLTKVSPIKNLIVKSISLKKTEYQIYYYGDLKILANILKINQLMINYEKNYCSIKLK